MAVSCEPADLAEAAKCIECGIPVGMQLPVMIYLMAQIAGVSTANSDAIAELVANARCIEHCVPMGMQLPVLISLACEIAE